MNLQFIPEPCTKYFGLGIFIGVILFLFIYWLVAWYYDRKRKQDGVPEIYDASSSKEANSKEINECVKQDTIEYVG